jgi:4,5-DOPA dioxygenase extradiol
LAISAHFYARGTYVNDAEMPEQIYDMYGFPEDPDSSKAFQSIEHYAPLLYVVGASDEKDPLLILNDEETLGAISMTSFLLG